MRFTKFSTYLPLLMLLLLSGCGFNSLFYYPDVEKIVVPTDAELIKIPLDENQNITGLFYPVEKPTASIFFLHGNAGNLNSWKPIVDDLHEANFQVYIIDYPGFGDSDGKPKHKNVIKSAQSAFDDFCKKPEVIGTKVILMGFSLGGNLATKIGTDNQEKIDAMVIEGAFSSHKAIGANRTPRPMKFSAYLVMRNTINGKKLMRKWTKPLLIVHSTEDPTCPYHMGVDLYQNAASEQKELWTIDGKHLQGLQLYLDDYISKLNALVRETN